eukprot:SAG31_NODE_9285_length_1304_cov_1.281328_2_plen_188_part_00
MLENLIDCIHCSCCCCCAWCGVAHCEAVACLFMVEVDNLFYERCLPEHIRTKVETTGRLVLTAEGASVNLSLSLCARVLSVSPLTLTLSLRLCTTTVQDTAALTRSKAVYMTVVTATVFVSIATAWTSALFNSMLVVIFGSLVGGVVEVLAGPSRHKCKQLGIVALKFFGGLMCFLGLLGAALPDAQ